MKSTQEIKKRLDTVEAELSRINKLMLDNPNIISEKFVFLNGNYHPEWTFNEALTSYVAKKLELKWVLGSY
jgi:hypothetical protein